MHFVYSRDRPSPLTSPHKSALEVQEICSVCVEVSEFVESRLAARGGGVRCCGDTIERQRKILSHLNTPGYAAQKLYSEVQTLKASSVF